MARNRLQLYISHHESTDRGKVENLKNATHTTDFVIELSIKKKVNATEKYTANISDFT